MRISVSAVACALGARAMCIAPIKEELSVAYVSGFVACDSGGAYTALIDIAKDNGIT